jgi:hypothetical protein
MGCIITLFEELGRLVLAWVLVMGTLWGMHLLVLAYPGIPLDPDVGGTWVLVCIIFTWLSLRR